MDTEDLHHKRRAKKAQDHARRRARRSPYAKVLIVCEGEKTEPLYFADVINHHAINSANVEVCNASGSDPLSVFNHGWQRYREAREAGDPFDRVFCVFDRDSHANYHQALTRLASATPYGCFVAITSVPCFEYWLLLHFEYSTRTYTPLPGNSTARQVAADLRKQMPEYSKGREGLYTKLLPRLEVARHNAARGLRELAAEGRDNPSTRVHELVDFLRNIKAADAKLD